ncbi:MAG: EAL domain-containing protein, partial [Acidobacteriota bacterium]
ACYELYDTEMHESAVESRQLESELRRALSEEQLALHYQPILSTATGRLWGFEALARWNHPQRGLLDASAWLASVRAAGLSARLDTWVLATAIAHLARWRDRFPERADAMLSLNLTGESVLRTETSETILRLCEEHGVHPATVIVEIAESDLVEIGEPAVDALWQLHNRGVRLWIDDFGLGALPIARLHRLPVDALKVDARLIEAINPGEDALEVVRAVEVLGRSFGMTTIAEGIETAEQVREIRRLSIARAQGFYLAAPVPADEADQILERGLDLPMAELTTSD